MSKRLAALLLAVILAAAGAGAQFPGGGGGAMASFRGVWTPVVGLGATYEVISKKVGKNEMEIAIVGSELHMGKTGYWVETVVSDRGKPMISKLLTVADGKSARPVRMVVQPPGEEAMEFPMEMMGMMGGARPQEQKTDFRETAVKVGTETITVPAGTFTCDHWRASDGSAEVWVAEKAGPWGVVKSISGDTTMTLIKATTSATSKIKGTPRKMDLQQMMRDRQ